MRKLHLCFRSLLFFLWSIVLAGFALQAAAQQEAANGMVKVLASEVGGDPQREGSGFVVAFEADLTFIATAAHVIEGDPQPRVIFAAAPHQFYEATPVRIAADSDIAVLKVVGIVPGVVALPFDQSPVAPADPIQAIGFPRRALQPLWSTAAASANEGGRIVVDKGLAEGYSGGPLLRLGSVVGLIGATERDYAYAMPIAFVSQILESWRIPFNRQITQGQLTAPRIEVSGIGSVSLVSQETQHELILRFGSLSFRGFGPVQLRWLNISGLHAVARSSDRSAALVVRANIDPATSDEFVIVRLEVDEDDKVRSLKLARAKIFSMGLGGVLGADGDYVIGFITKPEGRDVWRILPKSPLQPGEYGLYNGKGGVYDFGID